MDECWRSFSDLDHLPRPTRICSDESRRRRRRRRNPIGDLSGCSAPLMGWSGSGSIPSLMHRRCRCLRSRIRLTLRRRSIGASPRSASSASRWIACGARFPPEVSVIYGGGNQWIQNMSMNSVSNLTTAADWYFENWNR